MSSDSENNSGNQSLDWDSNEEATSPSFIKDTRESDVAVDEIIKNIQNLDSQLVTEQSRDKVKRKKTSTDYEFLEGPATKKYHFSWPPKYPSQEPEYLEPAGLPEIEVEESEVFSGDSDPEATTDCLKTILTEKFEHLLSSSSCSSGMFV